MIEKKSTKERIIETAWKLFLEKGYEETTLQDIISKSNTSRGGFYHHFRAKEDLLFRMAWYFDQNYDSWLDSLEPDMHAIDKLSAFDLYSLQAVENSPYRSFLPQLYGYEVMTEGRRYILDENREYFKLINTLVLEGQNKGEITNNFSCYEITRKFAGLQRGLVYSWLLENTSYPLSITSHSMMQIYLESIKL